MRNCLPPFLCGFLLLSTGCATLVRGDKQTLKIITEPPGATLLVDGKEFVTPADPTMLFYATADKQTNQKTIPYTPVGWGRTLLEALADCVRAIHKFPYEGP